MFKKISLAYQILKVLLAIAPFIRVLVEQFEIPGNGEEKKKAVLAALEQVIDSLPWSVSEEVCDYALAIAGGLIDLIIGILNLLGHDWSKK
jgi:hypothetical protein